jgi:hypothetical protein
MCSRSSVHLPGAAPIVLPSLETHLEAQRAGVVDAEETFELYFRVCQGEPNPLLAAEKTSLQIRGNICNCGQIVGTRWSRDSQDCGTNPAHLTFDICRHARFSPRGGPSLKKRSALRSKEDNNDTLIKGHKPVLSPKL